MTRSTALDDFARLARSEQGLGVVSTSRADHTIQSSVVNLGVMDHPVSGGDIVAFVTYGKVKLANLRARPRLSLTVRAGWNWLAVEGDAEIIGPDDPQPSLADPDALRLLLREVFAAAGGTHDDWAEYDAVMARERRAVVLVAPSRVYSNGG